MKGSFLNRFSHSQSGIATLTVLVFASTMLLLVGAMFTYARGFAQSDLNSILLYNSVEMIKRNITQVAYNDDSWLATVAQNQADGRMGCFNKFTTPLCTHGTLEEISLHVIDSTGSDSVYYNGLDPSYGFALDGVPCINYFPKRLQKVAGAPLCVIKVNVSWKPVCGVDCEVPPERLILNLSFSTPIPVTADDVRETVKYPAYRLNPEKVDGPIPMWNKFR